MMFLGISLIILALLLINSANNIEKIKKNLKMKLKNFQKNI